MVTKSLKNYTDENIIELIESLKSKSIAYNLNDLKAVLAEVNNRHLDGDYAAVLGDLIRDKILNGDKEEPKNEQVSEETKIQPAITEEKLEKPEKKNKKEKIKSVQEQAMEQEYEEEPEKFPVLCFMVGFLKFMGWFSLSVSVLYGLFESITKYLSTIKLAIGSIFLGLLVGTVLLLLFYSKAESILVKLEMERHLRKISGDE